MGTINSFGNILLPSGSNTVDVQGLLNAAIAAQQAPLQLLQQQQNTIQVQTAVLQDISGDVNNLATAIGGLSSTSGAINSFTAASSDSTVLSATADSTAAAGTHSIVVNSLATTASYYTGAVASGTTAISTGSFQIAVGSNQPVTITVDSTNNTLNQLAASINGQNLGVTANVVNDANGARLAIVSNTSGAAGNITVSNDSTGLGFTRAVTGLNASLTVDGVPINSASNTVSGVIPGVTLSLAGAAPGETVSLTLAPDTSQATTAINQFVSSWNTVMQDLNSQFNVASDGTGGGPLEADSILRGVQDQLLSGVTYAIGGNNGFVNLASIGINMNEDGTLTVNSGTLSNALSNNYTSVQNLLQGTAGVAAALSNTLTQINDPSQGSIALDLQGLTQTNQSLTQQIDAMQSQLAVQTQNLTAQYAQMEATIQEMPGLQSEISQQLAALKS